VFNAVALPSIEVINTIIRRKAGNFKLILLLFSQIKRLWKINRLKSLYNFGKIGKQA
jgi:hypothetical protein